MESFKTNFVQIYAKEMKVGLNKPYIIAMSIVCILDVSAMLIIDIKKTACKKYRRFHSYYEFPKSKHR